MSSQRSALQISKYTVIAYFLMGNCAAFHIDGDPTFSRNDNGKEQAGPESEFTEGTNLKSSKLQFPSWEPILDGKIIGAIGSLFSPYTKSESNRERMQREKLRQVILFNELTKRINDPAQLYALKKKSSNAPRFIHQVIN